MNNGLKEIVDRLELLPHPEGGYFREIYRCGELIKKDSLHDRYGSDRNISTSIYYLLAENQVSHFHKLKSDEIWHFYFGSTVLIHCLNETEGYSLIKLGNKFNEGILPQCVIRKETWFAAEVEDKNSFSLTGCTVAPGFDFNDFEMAEEESLKKLFPDHIEIIDKFTNG